MNKHRNKLTSTQSQSRIAGKKNLVQGGIIVLFIAISPFLYYSYESFPDSKVWETFLFTWKTSYPSYYQYAWFLLGKITPLILLLIWFFTCKHWWHWIILVPIAMYSFQLMGIIKQNHSVDEIEIYYLLPLLMVLIPSVYLIRAKLFDKVRGDDLREFEEELGRKRTVLQQILDLFR